MSFQSIRGGRIAHLVFLAVAASPALADTFNWQPVCNVGNPLWYDQCLIGTSCPGDTAANHNNWGRSVCGFAQPEFPDFGDDVVVATGHATMNLPANMATLSVSSSMALHHLMSVTGSVNISGVLDFQGEIAGAVTTTVTPTGAVTSNNAIVDSGTFVNQGTLNHVGPLGFRLENGAHLINNGAMFLQNESSLGSINAAAVDRLTNNNLITRNSGATVFTINDIKFDNLGTLSVQTGTLEIRGSANIGTNIGVIDISPGAVLLLGSSANRIYTLGSGGSVTGTGRLRNGQGTLFISAPYSIHDLDNTNGTILNHSNLTIMSALKIHGSDLSGSGTTTIAPGAVMTLDQGFDHFGAHSLVNNGTINWSNFLSVNVDSGFVLNNAGLWQTTGGGPAGPGAYINSGTLRTVGGFVFNGNQSFTNSGLVEVMVNGFIVDHYTQTAGTTRLQPGTSFGMTNGSLMLQAGLLEGNGSVSAPVVNSGGVVSPGLSSSPVYQMVGLRGYAQGSAGTLRIHLGGTPASGQFDAIHTTSNFPVVLDGTLEVLFANGYVPQSGQVFDIISHGTNVRSGQFAQIVDATTPCVGQPRFTIQYLPNSVRLVVAPGQCGVSGDMSGNGAVDAGDVGSFIIAVLGGTYNACADVNHDCAIDGRDVAAFVDAVIP